MNMKKILFVCLAFMMLVGCKPKNNPTTIFDFEVNISRIESYRVWVDIFPKDEFLRYNLEVLTIDQWNIYQTDQTYMDALGDILSSYTDEQFKMVTDEGAYLSAMAVDCPNTRYYLIITALDGRKPTQIRKVEFTTLEEHFSNFSLEADSITMTGDGLISVSPEDTVDTYFWNYELKSVIDRDWYGSHLAWFYYDMEYYYQMDFFPDMLSKGKDSENFFKFYNYDAIEEGDTICLLAVGYDYTGETNDRYFPFYIIYGGTEKASTVVKAYPDSFDSYSILRKCSTAREACLSPSWHSTMPSRQTDRYIPQHIRSRK